MQKDSKIEGARAVDPEILFLYQLDADDELILQFMLKFKSMKPSHIAAATGLSMKHVSKRIKRPAFQQALGDLMLPMTELMKDLAIVAARRLRQLCKDPDKRIAMQAVKLALAPYANQTDVNVNMKPLTRFITTVQPDGSLLQKIIEEDRRRSEQETIDVEAKESEGNG